MCALKASVCVCVWVSVTALCPQPLTDNYALRAPPFMEMKQAIHPHSLLHLLFVVFALQIFFVCGHGHNSNNDRHNVSSPPSLTCRREKIKTIIMAILIHSHRTTDRVTDCLASWQTVWLTDSQSMRKHLKNNIWGKLTYLRLRDNELLWHTYEIWVCVCKWARE